MLESISQESLPDDRVCVVALTYNRREELLRTLDFLLDLPEKPEIVVVDNASTDGTAEAMRSGFPQIKHIRLDTNLGAAARNLGVRNSRRPYIAFCDDDTWWGPGSLRKGADLLDAYPKLALMTARVLVGPEQRLDPTCAEMARSPLPAETPLPGPSILGFLAGASIVRRSAFLQSGGFDPKFFLGGEEELLAIDLESEGWFLAYVEALTAYHRPSRLRNADSRRAMQLRNALWVIWLRRPLGRGLTATFSLLVRSLRDPIARRAAVSALAALPWAMRRRKAIPSRVERRLRLLEDQRAGKGGKTQSAGVRSAV
jgi:GT2 family glycosyltransferase